MKGEALMKWQFNKKNTTYAIYACGVILFAVICIGFMTNKSSFVRVWDNLFNAIISPIFFGIIIAYLLNPILRGSERLLDKITSHRIGKKSSRAIGLVITYLLFLIFVTGFLLILIPQFIQSLDDLATQAMTLVNNIPIHLQEAIDNNDSFAKFYEMITSSFDLQGFLDSLQGSVGTVIKITADYVLAFISTMTNLFLGLIFSIYFLASKELLVKQVKRFCLAFFSFRHNVALSHFVETVDTKFGQFIRGKLIDSTIVMLIVYLLTWIFGIPYYPMIAILIGVTDLIPVFGPFLGAIPSAAIILISPDGGLRATIIFAAIILVVQQIDGNILAPAILGDRVGISGVWIMIAVVLMGGLFGVFGMFFGVPIFAVIYTLVGESIHKRLVKKGIAEQVENEDLAAAPKGKTNVYFKVKRHFATHKEQKAAEKAESNETKQE